MNLKGNLNSLLQDHLGPFYHTEGQRVENNIKESGVSIKEK